MAKFFHCREEHEHKFEPRNYSKQFTCDGCKEPGFGRRYRCDHEGYELHEDCRFPKPTLSVDFFPNSTFQFFKTPQTSCGDPLCDEGKRSCDACGKDIKGYNYHCAKEGWDLHPCCSNLKKRLSIDGLTLELRDEKIRSRCMWCNETKILGGNKHVPGWSYVSGSGEYAFHVFCVKEMIPGDDASMAVAKLNLKQVAKARRKNNKWDSYWKILKVFVKAVISALIGDPTSLLATAIVELISNST